jgi:hypothetical protein
MKRVIAIAACSLLAALALAGPATAGDSPVTDAQYGDSASQVSGGGDPRDPGDPSDPSGDPSSVGSLPFTGLDVALMAVAAGGLVGAGLVMRRRTSGGESR